MPLGASRSSSVFRYAVNVSWAFFKSSNGPADNSIWAAGSMVIASPGELRQEGRPLRLRSLADRIPLAVQADARRRSPRYMKRGSRRRAPMVCSSSMPSFPCDPAGLMPLRKKSARALILCLRAGWEASPAGDVGMIFGGWNIHVTSSLAGNIAQSYVSLATIGLQSAAFVGNLTL